MKKILNICIAIVWLVNGLYCKILGGVPRHEEIVALILGPRYAFEFTKIIGFLEVLMCIWILSRFKSRTCAIIQIAVILLMNVIEFINAPQLLLFGKMNLFFAVLFSILIYITEFRLKSE